MDYDVIDDLSDGFVQEYLEREPEFLDVTEYVYQNVDDVISDELYTKVYAAVVGKLGDHAQRFADELLDATQQRSDFEVTATKVGR